MDTNILRLSILVIREGGKAGKKGPCVLICKRHHLLAKLIFLGNETFFEVQGKEVCFQALEEYS